MPYAIVKVSPKCWMVCNRHTGKVFSKCATLANAKRQVNLLHMIEHSNGAKHRVVRVW